MPANTHAPPVCRYPGSLIASWITREVQQAINRYRASRSRQSSGTSFAQGLYMPSVPKLTLPTPSIGLTTGEPSKLYLLVVRYEGPV